jgi:predicted metal-dependent hydrolase
MAEPATTNRDIVKRDIRFDLGETDIRRWHPEGLHVSQFFNALSLFFPEGESFFIDAVLHFRDRIKDPKLAEQVKGFLGQEAMHSREHRRYNRALVEAGLPAKELEDWLLRRLDFVRKYATPEEQLAVTIALEHFTAIMAHEVLSDDRILAGADPRMAAIWRWHAIEETEHKAVAYDVYRDVVGQQGLAYWRRARVMVMTTVTFWTFVFLYQLRLVRTDGAGTDVGGWWTLFRWLWIHPGNMRHLVRPWLDYFRRDFHPWQHDNHQYVEAWKAEYEAEGVAPA